MRLKPFPRPFKTYRWLKPNGNKTKPGTLNSELRTLNSERRDGEQRVITAPGDDLPAKSDIDRKMVADAAVIIGPSIGSVRNHISLAVGVFHPRIAVNVSFVSGNLKAF
jgi:hypothetical protein